MLTRFRKGTIICTSRNFVKNQAADSLVGELATYLGDETWVGTSITVFYKMAPTVAFRWVNSMYKAGNNRQTPGLCYYFHNL